jgi:glycerol-3-phosphate dehydrogenase (NAD(P)+)
VSAASISDLSASRVQQVFSAPYLRVYTNADVIGVELGGALKNVIAIASGISDGLKLGGNARAALITRGLAEITRLGTKMGAHPYTFSGLSGIGDLVLTCTGALSRNYTLGYEIGRGREAEEVICSMRMVAEGVKTSNAVKSLAASRGVEMPISEEVWKVIYEGKPAREAVMELMTRELKGE